MPFPQMSTDLDIVAALSDLPNETDGLTAAQLKAKFDEGPKAIKAWINTILLVALEENTAGVSAAERLGSAAISGVTGTTVWAQINSLKNQITDLIVGAIAEGSLTAAMMGADMTKDVAGGILAYDTFLSNANISTKRDINTANTVTMGGLL